jgi:TonB family protein
MEVPLVRSLVCFAAALIPGLVLGQTTVSGRVTDADGAPLVGVKVTANSNDTGAMTDESGKFQLSGITLLPAALKFRRLGFVPVDMTIGGADAQAATKLEVRMQAVPRTLSSVIINASKPEYSGRLAGYYQRLERRTSGYFISRDEIDRRSYRSLSQLLRTVPGLNSVPLRVGGNGIRMRGNRCRPLVWIDGVPMPAGEVDLDAFPTSTLHGIELYSGATTAPSDLQINGNLGSCGTIALWSRGPDTELPPRPKTASLDLTRLIESLSVFSADQVEQPAVVAGSDPLALAYPPELFAKGIGGSVLAEFVVDTTGKVESETINLVSSTDPLFSAAVLRALPNARYVPAMKGGHAVRQIVHQPYRFVPGQKKS